MLATVYDLRKKTKVYKLKASAKSDVSDVSDVVNNAAEFDDYKWGLHTSICILCIPSVSKVF